MRELVRHIDLIPKVIPLTLTLDMVLSFSLDNITTFIVSMFSWRICLFEILLFVSENNGDGKPVSIEFYLLNAHWLRFSQS